jgi:hypothetical protein
MTKCLEQRYYIKFCQKLGDAEVETIRKIQQAFGDDAKGVTHIKSGSNALRMAACRRTVTSVPEDLQRAEMLMPLAECRHRSWRTVREIADEVAQTRF